MCDNKSREYTVRQMKASDLEEVRQIWTSHNIYASKYHIEVMMKVDANGLFIAQELSTSKLLGTCIGINISPDLAFIGEWRVRPEYQKRGIGKDIWCKAMEHIGPDRNLGLFTRPPMTEVYRHKYNFNIFPERKNCIYGGNIDCKLLIEAIDGISVDPISEHNIQKVIQYDKQIYKGVETAKYLEYVCKVAVNQTGDILGYCMLRVTNHNKGIAEPLYANEDKIAELLLRKCCESHPSTLSNGMMYRCPSTNLKSVAIAKKLGFGFLRDSTLLLTKGFVQGDIDRVFCINSGCFYPF